MTTIILSTLLLVLTFAFIMLYTAYQSQKKLNETLLDNTKNQNKVLCSLLNNSDKK